MSNRNSRQFAVHIVRLAALVLIFSHWQLLSAKEPPARLIDQTPFDRITLTEKNNNEVIITEPINFPGRRVPAKPKPTDKIEIKIQGEAKKYEVLWGDIAKVELFENLILEEAEKHLTDGKLDAMHELLAYLVSNFPKAEGLPAARDRYLYASAADAFKGQRWPEALAVTEELFRQNPKFQPPGGAKLMQSLGRISDKIIEKYVADGDYRSARILLTRLQKQYQAEGADLGQEWVDKLSKEAEQFRTAAQAALAEKKYLVAYEAWAKMQNVWPDGPEAAALTATMERTYPLIIVGVTHPAKATTVRQVNDVAARRVVRLVDRTLLEFVGLGPEGGKYNCPWGQWERSDDGLAVTLKLSADSTSAEALTGYDIARRLLLATDSARPEYSAAFARLLGTVQVQNVQRVDVEFRRPHVLPDALMTFSIQGAVESTKAKEEGNFGPFQLLGRDAKQVRFVRNTDLPAAQRPKLAEIVERHFDDPKRALLALKRGEVDVIDSVFAGDLNELRDSTDIVVERYGLATTHLLLPAKPHPYVANRNFRRALVYATNREQILGQGLQQGNMPAGTRVISAPFLAPVSDVDPKAYGYDLAVQPRPWDPRLALALRILTEHEIKQEANRKMVAAPPLEPLVLGHPADELSRIACRGIVQQWETVGIPSKLVEFPPGEFSDAKNECHLVFSQTTLWEPLVDARRLLSTSSVQALISPHVIFKLQQLDGVGNWRDARERLRELHRFLAEELPVLPLWQTVDHFAYRKRLKGLATGSVTLYQDVENWSFQGTVPR